MAQLRASLARVVGAARRLSRVEAFQALVAFVAAALVLLWVPLTSGKFYGPGDFGQAIPLTRVAADGYRVENPHQIDVAVQYLPWLDWDRDQVRAGQLPLWNPYNGSGTPHLANGQSAVFSVFTLPFYLLSFRLALLVSALLQVVLACLMTYGLVRHLFLSHVAGIVAGIAFGFSAFNVMWLHWPMAASGVFLPGVVWGASAVAMADGRRRRLLALACMAVALALSLLAGHPETTFFAIAVAVAMIGARVAARCASGRWVWGSGLRRLTWVAGGLGLGVGLAAVQVLPLWEYVQNSAASDNRGEEQLFHNVHYLGLHAFPFVVGSPAHRYSEGIKDLSPPYMEASSIYVGLGVILLACVGLLSVRWTARRLPVVLAGLALMCGLYAYDVAGLGGLVGRLPLVGLVLAIRSSVVWALCLVVLAAFGVDGLLALAARRAQLGRPVKVAATAVGVLALSLVGGALLAQRHLRGELPGPPRGMAGLAARTARDHLVYVLATFALILIGAMGLTRGGRFGPVAKTILVGGVFLQSGFMLRDFNPAVEREYFYPTSTALDRITDVTGSAQTLRLDDTGLLPDMNLWYRMPSPGTYDALGVRDYDRLYRRVLRSPHVTIGGAVLGILDGPIDPEGLGGLRVLGIQYVTTARPYPFGDSAGGPVSGETVTTSTIDFTIVPTADRLDVMVVQFPGLADERTCELTVREQVTQLVIGRALGRCEAQGTAFSLPGIDVVSAEPLDVSVTSLDGPLATVGQPRMAAVATRMAGLELVMEVQGFRLFRVPESPDRYFSPAEVVAASRSGPWDVVDVPDAQPLDLSVVEAPGSGVAATAGRGSAVGGRVEVVEESTHRVRLRVTRGDPGWLIALQAAYPGWTATVDGGEVDISTANGAFIGLPVPAGSSEVVLEYRPSSVRLGLLVSTVSVVALLVVLFLASPLLRERPRCEKITAL